MRPKTIRDLFCELEHLDQPAIIFVTGPTGSGKSTFVSNLEHKLIAYGIHPGKAVRESKELKKMVLASENPTAPKISEAFVRKYIQQKINKIVARSPEATIAIDGIPRSVEQVTYCVDVAMTCRRLAVFVVLGAPQDERKVRLEARGDKEMAEKRLVSDEKVLPSVIERIRGVVRQGKFGLYFEINTGRTPNESTI